MMFSCTLDNVVGCLWAVGVVLVDLAQPIRGGEAEAAALHAYAELQKADAAKKKRLAA